MKLSSTDRTLLNRYVDGEMTVAECTEFEQRLARDTDLRSAEAVAREQSRLIRGVDVGPGRAPHGFSKTVLDAVRRMPSRDDLVRETADEATVASVAIFARRLTVAAAVLFAIATLFGLRVLVEGDTGIIMAEDKELEQLDKKVRAMKMEDLRRQQGR